MKLIEPTQKSVETDRVQKYLKQLKQVLPFGKTGKEGEEVIVAHFLRGLDNRFIMLRNLQLEGTGIPFPHILIGPHGLAVLNMSHAKGFYKVREETWWKMDKTNHRYDPARPNLIKQSQDYAKKLATILDVHGKSHPEVTPILIFANPGVNIETANPAIRVVLMDGVESLIGSFLSSDEILNTNEINFLADSLAIIANPDKAIPMGEGEDFFGRDLFVPEKKAPPKMPTISIPTEMPLPAVEEKLRFSKKQWVILAVLLLLTIVILLVAILYALSVV
jgi:hypothetical protein